MTTPTAGAATAATTAVVLMNLGTPDAPTPAALRRYLAQFLSDRRVVELPRWLWWPVLHGVILRTRPAQSARKYASIWRPEGSPLLYWSQRQAIRLLGSLGEAGHRVLVHVAMRYGSPALPDVMDELMRQGVQRVLVLPLYPQYSATTTASAFDAVAQWLQHTRRLPELRFVNDYHDDPAYIDALASSVRAHWQREGRGERLVMSFHGIPARCVERGDPYRDQCLRTAGLLANRLGLPQGELVVSFQSRLGRARWLEPYTEPTLRQLAAQGVRVVDAMCPGFAADNLETLEEIAIEGRDAFVGAGGDALRFISCLNDDDAWIRALAGLAQRHLQGWATRSGTPAT